MAVHPAVVNWERFAALHPANATFPTPPTRHLVEDDPARRALIAALKWNENYTFRVDPGTYFVDFALDLIASSDVDDAPVTPVVWNCDFSGAESVKLAFPGKFGGSSEVLRYCVDERLMRPGPKVVVFVNTSRADAELRNAIMEIQSELQTGNYRPDQLLCCIMIEENLDEVSDSGRSDAAQADRTATTDRLTRSSSLADRYIAREFADIDLRKTLTTYHSLRLDPRSEKVFCPRALSNVLFALVHGFPGHFGLPWYGGDDHVVLLDRTGDAVAERDEAGVATKTVNEKVIEQLAAAAGLHAPSSCRDPIDKAARLMAAGHRFGALGTGLPGTGKSSHTEEVLARLVAELGPGHEFAKISNGYSYKEDYGIAFRALDPVTNEPTGGLRQVMFDFLGSPRKKILVIDEFTRSPDESGTNASLEIVERGSLNYEPVPGLLGVIALNNPTKTANGAVLDARPLTLSQALAFRLSFHLDSDNTGAIEWLLASFPDIAPIVEWRREVVPDDIRPEITARALKRLHYHAAEDLPLHWALPCPDGERVDAPIAELREMLANREQPTIGKIARSIDSWVERLAERDTDGRVVNAVDHSIAYEALDKTEFGILMSYRSECVRLFEHLEDYWFYLVTHENRDKQSFFRAINEEVNPL